MGGLWIGFRSAGVQGFFFKYGEAATGASFGLVVVEETAPGAFLHVRRGDNYAPLNGIVVSDVVAKKCIASLK